MKNIYSHRMRIKSFKTEGFTLVELAIVIVIIGLLVGGVLQGQSLIETSKINRTVTDFKAYQAGVTMFKAKYNALPGDFLRGHPTFPRCGGSATYANSGDGDGHITWGGDPNEDLKAWCHLSAANVIKGTYTGNYMSGMFQAGTNVPGGAYEASIYWLNSTLIAPGDVDLKIYGRSGVRIILGQQLSSPEVRKGVMYAETAKLIDEKMDDGSAKTGNLVPRTNYADESGCIDANNEYIISSNTRTCKLNYFIE
jgi:prepilin-type N-terminal cleavage/methylation domain-containing protein